MDTASLQQIKLFTPTFAVTLVKEITTKVTSKEFSSKAVELEGEAFYRLMLKRLSDITEDVARYFDDRYKLSSLNYKSDDKINEHIRWLVIGYYLLVELIEHSIKRTDITSQDDYVDEKGIDYADLMFILISPPSLNTYDTSVDEIIEHIKALQCRL